MSKPEMIHFVGIGGIGMSGIAKVMLEQGNSISGSDLRCSPITDRLATLGATILQGHSAAHLGDPSLVVVSSAVPPDNPEVLEARRRGIPVIKRAEMLGQLMRDQFSIAVAGTHGKTTTASLISLILEEAGLEPTILVGGELVDLDTNAKLGRGRYLVAEADEFDGSLQCLSPQIAVVTNIEADHLDFYGTLEAVVRAFLDFVASVPPEGYILLCGDDPRMQRWLEGDRESLKAQIGTYGLGVGLDWRATNLCPNHLGGSDFSVEHHGQWIGDFWSLIPGQHNVSNALAAIAVASILGIDMAKVRRTLGGFHGARRRFELKGEVAGITIIEDYAHHPTEIRATLAAARERFGQRRILCLFQPHTYSRTKFLLGEFARSFDQADQVLISEIYPAREHDTLGISSAHLVAAMHHPQAFYVASLEEAATHLLERLRAGDVLLILGAGDVDRASGMLLAALEERNDACLHR